MRPKDCAYIVEHLSVRFMAMVADHSRQLAEHRAAFGARTEADAKIIAGLRSEIGAAQMAVLERDSLISERDGLLTQVQDMRVEINRLQWENMTMHKDAEDGYTEAIKVLGDPIALSKERDALRAEVAALQERLRRVTLVDDDGSEPCDPPGATAKLTPKIGDTVRLVTHPERAQVAKHLRFALQWPWMPRWGLVGQTGKVVKPLDAVAGAVAVALDGSTIFARWPIDCLEVVAEATHDTEAGKAAAESGLLLNGGLDVRKVTT